MYYYVCLDLLEICTSVVERLVNLHQLVELHLLECPFSEESEQLIQVCMWPCVCVCVCVCVYMCVHVCVCVYTHDPVYVCMWSCAMV